jgi:hypothetical protein
LQENKSENREQVLKPALMLQESGAFSAPGFDKEIFEAIRGIQILVT